MQHRGEAAADHKVDVSVAEFPQQSIEFRHRGVRLCSRDRLLQAATPYLVPTDVVARAVPARDASSRRFRLRSIPACSAASTAFMRWKYREPESGLHSCISIAAGGAEGSGQSIPEGFVLITRLALPALSQSSFLRAYQPLKQRDNNRTAIRKDRCPGLRRDDESYIQLVTFLLAEPPVNETG